MTAQIYKIAIWNENCHLAGRQCFQDDRRDSESGYPEGDVTIYEGTDAEIAEEAKQLLEAAKSAGAGRDLYLSRTAHSLLEAIGQEEEEEESEED